MNQINRDSVSGETLRRHLWLRLKNGVEQVKSEASKRHILVGYIVAAILAWTALHAAVSVPLNAIVRGVYDTLLPLVFSLGCWPCWFGLALPVELWPSKTVFSALGWSTMPGNRRACSAVTRTQITRP